MKQRIGLTLYPIVFALCLIIFFIGIVGIAIKALFLEAFMLYNRPH
jgi:hypothetical protein